MSSPSTLHLHISSSFLILISLAPIVSLASSNLTVGNILSTSDQPLSSPSGDFTFGFKLLSNGNSYLLSIWYTNIPDTIVWYATYYSGNVSLPKGANDGDGVLAPGGSTLNLSSSQGLRLEDPRGNNKLWVSSLGGGNDDTVQYCFLNDTGNLMIMSTGGRLLWQSFDHPTDTLLPTQTIPEEKAVYSRLRESNFTRGLYQMILIEGNFLLNVRDSATDMSYDSNYYNSSTGNTSRSGYRLIYGNSGYMYISANDRFQVNLTTVGDETPSPQNYYVRATLNFDGVFSWYYHEKSSNSDNSSWISFKSVPEDICNALIRGSTESGACGNNAICTLDNDQRPICQCPPFYSWVDPSNTYGHCKPNFDITSCENQQNSSEYRMIRLSHTNWPFGDFDNIKVSNEDDCRKLCLEDCFCAAAIFGLSETCWKKRFPLTNGVQGSTGIGTAFIKVKNADTDASKSSNANGGNDNKGTIVVISALLGTSAFFNIVVFGLIGLLLWYFYNKKQQSSGGCSRTGNCKHHEEYDTVRCFTYQELEEATDGFKEELGRGACAIVYKGSYRRGSNLAGTQSSFAVKKIDLGALKEADREFKTEVGIIGQTHHRNLVKLIGFCDEEQHRMLVCEFMSNGTLADLLFGELRPSWSIRIHIAKGIARGLLYLHEECASQIIHCDIKGQNILLDESYNAKISDFGLSKLLKLNQFQTHTAVRGTKGYVAPDWFKNKAVDVKVDVYSFGVLLLEIVSCRRCVLFNGNDEKRAILTDWTIDCYLSEQLADLVQNDSEALKDLEEVKRLVKIAIWCVQEDPRVRPTIRQVSQMLESVVEVPNPPCPEPDSFILPVNDFHENAYFSSPSKRNVNQQGYSII